MDIIKVIAKHIAHEKTIESIAEMSESNFFIHDIPKISESVSPSEIVTLTNPIFTIGGSTLIIKITMPINPTPDFIKSILARMVSQTSETAFPTIGTPLDTINFIAFDDTLSDKLVIELCKESVPENRNIEIVIIQLTYFFISLTISPNDISLHRLFTQHNPKQMLINGSISLSAN